MGRVPGYAGWGGPAQRPRWLSRGAQKIVCRIESFRCGTPSVASPGALSRAPGRVLPRAPRGRVASAPRLVGFSAWNHTAAIRRPRCPRVPLSLSRVWPRAGPARTMLTSRPNRRPVGRRGAEPILAGKHQVFQTLVVPATVAPAAPCARSRSPGRSLATTARPPLLLTPTASRWVRV